jgi:hypothetical protein
MSLRRRRKTARNHHHHHLPKSLILPSRFLEFLQHICSPPYFPCGFRKRKPNRWIDRFRFVNIRPPSTAQHSDVLYVWV